MSAGFSTIHHLDIPWKPSELEQRNGHAVRKGNLVAKEFAGDKVDTFIYAVEKSLDNYKFGLLHNKQLFINQLKTRNLATRTIDEGAMDEKSGMNFSEYVAILSGNTDLLDKAKIEKKIAALESERQAFNKGKANANFKLSDISHTIESNNEFIFRMQGDWQTFQSRLIKDKDGNSLNPIQLNNVQSSDVKTIAAKLEDIDKNAYTNGEYFKIGTLYGFNLLVKTESSRKNEIGIRDNRFFIEGEGSIKYSYNNGRLASDPKLATLNFLNALEKIPSLIERYQKENNKLSVDLPVLKEVVSGTWKKEDELKGLKSELAGLERKIQLSLKPIEDRVLGNTKEENESLSKNEFLDGKQNSKKVKL